MAINNYIFFLPFANLAAGIESTTSVFSDTALLLAAIAAVMSVCFFITYVKRTRNRY